MDLWNRFGGKARKPREKTVVRLVVTNWILGALVGVICGVAVLASDIGGVRTLLFGSDQMWAGLVLLFGGFMTTFGGVVCATAIMSLPYEDEDKGPRGGKRERVATPQLALAKAPARR